MFSWPVVWPTGWTGRSKPITYLLTCILSLFIQVYCQSFKPPFERVRALCKFSLSLLLFLNFRLGFVFWAQHGHSLSWSLVVMVTRCHGHSLSWSVWYSGQNWRGKSAMCQLQYPGHSAVNWWLTLDIAHFPMPLLPSGILCLVKLDIFSQPLHLKLPWKLICSNPISAS